MSCRARRLGAPPFRYRLRGDISPLRRRVTLPAAARRRNGPGHLLLARRGNSPLVRFSPFPPDGENCDRSLAPPFPGEPAALGFAGSTGEINQNATGDGSGWALACPYSPYPGLRFTGVSPEKFSRISGAQNLSGLRDSRRATGPWVCKNFRWCGSTTAPGLAEQVIAGP